MMFKRSIKATFCAVLAVGAMSSGAIAATVFDFTGALANLGSTEVFALDGITLDVSSNGGDIHRNSHGIGITGDGSNRIESSSQVLTFEFSAIVNLSAGVFFEHGDGSEGFDIRDGDSNILGSYSASGDGSGGHSLVTFSNLNLFGDKFTINHTSGSGIRVNQITVSAIPAQLSATSLSAVPLPASLPMALMAFAGLGLFSRRRNVA
ncbi:VPLPA-CTERM sorting domain-containing protein [Tateyamaria sp. Alg231-49]|uniref:VPLPA-CTERM sorting domain-containing protein n=1 Tax=Tateyamaria sp. Alg231-49 TaxID=1922219 RepID=UPI00131F3880|nr:VPLPA-CTERM sorting domain-containing protein [Tateyamaria sp. Alg231-49]